MVRSNFGKTNEGKNVEKYTIKNASIELSVINLGATIVKLKVPDKNSRVRDIVLGYDSPQEYQNNNYYFGAVIGRNANRIENARCEIEGTRYQLEANDNENNLHSGSNGFHNAIWNIDSITDDAIVLSYDSKDGDQGFPGNMHVKVTYILDDNNGLTIKYEATTDNTTVANMTNHSYFNLNGHDYGSIEDHELKIYASYYTPVKDTKSIPIGDLVKVADTPMDFRDFKKIGAQINENFEQLKFTGGYDHNYCIDKAYKSFQLASRAKGDDSGITMDLYTDCVGLQFYSGNFIKKHKGKEKAVYDSRQGFCLETQFFPNALNDEDFASPVFRPDEVYESVTKFVFKTS